jgi:glycosyltransferase involved in cell wall biosynthesis
VKGAVGVDRVSAASPDERASGCVPMAQRPLRIAHFTLGRCNPESANGVDQTVYHLARSQSALGHEVAVFSLTNKPPLPVPGVTVYTCPPIALPLPFLTRRQYDLLVTRAPWNVPRQLVRQIKEWQPDVLHLHFVHIPPNVFLARKLAPRVPYCVTINGGLSPLAQRRRRWAKRLFRVFFEGPYLERAAFLHAISEEDVRGLESFGVSNTTVVAPNGIDLQLLEPVRDDCARAWRDDRFTGKRVFLFLGRLDPQQKGLDVLVDAFAACGVDASVLVLAGPDWRGGRAQLEAIAASRGISGSVVFTGSVFGKQKHELLRTADVFVHPSRWEAGVPFSVLEAAALERPCLLSDAADPARVLADGGAALRVAPAIDPLANALREFRTLAPDALRAMGRRAREVVDAEFSWPRTAAILIDAYRRHGAGARG